MTFNLLPLKYQWAYDLYRTMKANHWEPEDIPMGKDIEQWRDTKAVSDVERWIIRMGIGYFSAAEGIVGDNIQHVVRELVTAPELKLVLGRHAHEENIHADSLLYMIASLGINPHECEAMFEDVPTIVRKNEFVTRISRELRRDLDLTKPENKKLLASNIFVFGQCMEGTQFYGLFGMILSLYRQNKFPGIGQMFRYTLRDESNHIEVFRNLFMDLVEENREIWTPEYKEELRGLMREAVALEKDFIRDCLPVNAVGLRARGFPNLHRLHRRSPPRRLRPGAALRRHQESAALARRDDGHREGAELFRGPGHRVPESFLLDCRLGRRALKSEPSGTAAPFCASTPPSRRASPFAPFVGHCIHSPTFIRRALRVGRFCALLYLIGT